MAKTSSIDGGTSLQSRSSARSSRTVAAMKLLLPSIALALVALIFLWPQLLMESAHIDLANAKIDILNSDTLRMRNPRFVGVDEKDQPFEIVAKSAVQERDNSNRITLDQPDASITSKDGTWINMRAGTGVWLKTDGLINLTGEVSVFHDAGHQLATDAARVDLKRGSIVSNKPAIAQGPNGFIEGEGFVLLERGAKIRFTGKTKALLHASTGSDE